MAPAIISVPDACNQNLAFPGRGNELRIKSLARRSTSFTLRNLKDRDYGLKLRLRQSLSAIGWQLKTEDFIPDEALAVPRPRYFKGTSNRGFQVERS
jgi:hypothetical protein